MASTSFQDYNSNNPVTAAWLNDVNQGVYSQSGVAHRASQSAAAWARFSITGGVVSITQSVNVSSIVRTGAGVYNITFTVPMLNAANSYGLSMSRIGFMTPGSELTTGFTLTCVDNTNTAVDPSFACFQVFGAN